MRIKSVLKMLLLTIFLIAPFNSLSFAQLDPLVSISTSVNVDLYSTLTASPTTVEAGQYSSILVYSIDANAVPKMSRSIELYIDGVSTGVGIIQPNPTYANGTTTGFVASTIPGTYIIRAKDITEGYDITFDKYTTLIVVPVAVPTLNSEPTYTAGSSNTLSWSTTGTNTYEYYIEASTTSDFSGVVSNSGWISSTSHTFSGLLNDQVYYYRVKARNMEGVESAWSNTTSSMQDTAAPTVTYVSGPTLPADTTTTTFDPNATLSLSYTVQESNGIASKNIEVVLLDGTKVSVPFTETFDGTNWNVIVKLGNLPKDTNGNLYTAYSFYASVTDLAGNTGGNGTANISVTPGVVTPPPPTPPPTVPPSGPTAPTTPGVPVLVSPTDDLTPSFTWVPSYDSQTGEVVPSYKIQWCSNADFTGCDSNIGTTSENSITLSTNLPVGIWYFRVISTSKDGINSEWSEGVKITLEKSEDVGEPPVEDPSDTPSTWYEKIAKEVNKVINSINSILDTTLGEIEPETIQNIAIVTAVTNIGLIMGMILNLLGTLPHILLQGSLALLSILGFRKKGNLSGFVYDSVSKNPISQVVVRLFNERNELIWTDVSDSKGRFRMPVVENGNYYIVVSASGYRYPSQIVFGNSDFPLENVYRGGIFVVSNSEIPKFSIPLDKGGVTNLRILFESFVSRTKWFWKSIHILLFFVGFAFALYALNMNPVWWNYVIAILYIPSLIMLLLSLFVFGKKDKYGIVRDERRERISGITVTLSDSEFDKVESTRVTDDAGRYRFLVDKGSYNISILSRDYVLLNGDKYKKLKVKGGSTTVLCPNLTVKKNV